MSGACASVHSDMATRQQSADRAAHLGEMEERKLLRDELQPGPPPLAGDAWEVQFTADRAFRDKLREAQRLLRHRVPDGDLGAILEEALEVLINH